MFSHDVAHITFYEPSHKSRTFVACYQAFLLSRSEVELDSKTNTTELLMPTRATYI